ncbi:DUF6125 family protein [Chloroflexota bacterium]
MPEMKDYSGQFKPELQWEDFSKEFLIKLMKVWQYAWLEMAGQWYNAVRQRFGFDAASECEYDAWVNMAKRVNPRYAKVANIELNTVLDSLKAMQLPLDNTMGQVFPVEYDIKNENHVIVTVWRCPPLEYFEREEPDRIHPMCHVAAPVIDNLYAINPNVKGTPLKLPPRQSPDEPACIWEWKLVSE